MDLLVRADGTACWGGRCFRCALGRSGISREKREGDGATPAGAFAMRRVLFRADRLARPAGGLPVAPLRPDDGWCDDPADADYNRPVTLPHPARAEALWREDAVYDVIVILGHNDDPPVPFLGSAVFLHVAAPGLAPTAGCVALAAPDLLAVLAGAAPGARLVVAG